MLITDSALQKLYSLDATKEDFSTKLYSMIPMFAENNPKRTKEEIKKILDVVYQFAMIDPEFTKPLFIVQYSRIAFKYRETYKPQGIFTAKGKEKFYEYQITMDRDIQVFEIDPKKLSKKTLWNYVKEDLEKIFFISLKMKFE